MSVRDSIETGAQVLVGLFRLLESVLGSLCLSIAPRIVTGTAWVPVKVNRVNKDKREMRKNMGSVRWLTC